jgi:hypothetical protein
MILNASNCGERLKLGVKVRGTMSDTLRPHPGSSGSGRCHPRDRSRVKPGADLWYLGLQILGQPFALSARLGSS